jgi:hypothetical protein
MEILLLGDHSTVRRMRRTCRLAAEAAFNELGQTSRILHIAFTLAPIIAGLDKFAHFLVNRDR